MAFNTLVLGGLFGVISTALTAAYCACKAAKTIPSDRIALEEAYEAACLASACDGHQPLPQPVKPSRRPGFIASANRIG